MDNIELTTLQNKSLDLILEGKNIFITGKSGSGKSTLIRFFIDNYSYFKKIGVTSTTGISALNIGGKTLHSYLKIGLGTDSTDDLYKSITASNFYKRIWTSLQILIIDEISMLSIDLFEKLEHLARLIRKNDKPFGGIQLVFLGDNLQLPVVNDNRFCFESEIWDICIDHTIFLTEIVRQADPIFQKVLNKVRKGKVDDFVKEKLDECVNKKLKNEFRIKPTKIFSTNDETSFYNNKKLNTLLKKHNYQLFEYKLDIEWKDQKYKNQRDKYVKNCIAPELLRICKDAQVMLIFNLNLDRGLCNGSRGIVTDIIEDIPVITFLNGETEYIHYNEWIIKDGKKHICSLFQIPLRLGWAFTCHKTQSLTLDLVEIDMSRIFEYGQAYVALSRVKNMEGLSIINPNYKKIFAHPKALEYYKKLKEQKKT